jgi:hypothetical protein
MLSSIIFSVKSLEDIQNLAFFSSAFGLGYEWGCYTIVIDKKGNWFYIFA